MFYSEEMLLSKISEKGIVPVKCSYDIEKNEIILDGADISSLIEYATINNVRHIFYKYWYHKKEDYIIDTYSAEVDFGEFYNIASKDIKSHNKKIELLDFGLPAIMVAFCLHQGALILIHKDATWAEGLVNAEDALREIRLEYNEQIAKIKIKQAKEREFRKELLENELKMKILEDEEFSLCTNQRMRKLYIDTFLGKQENDKYKELFMVDPNNYFPGKAATFAEIIWSHKKISAKKEEL